MIKQTCKCAIWLLPVLFLAIFSRLNVKESFIRVRVKMGRVGKKKKNLFCIVCTVPCSKAALMHSQNTEFCLIL